MKTKELVLHLKLFVRPLLGSTFIGIIWYSLFYKFHLHIIEADEPAFTDFGIPVLAMFHAIVAGGVLVKVWEEHKIVQRCIRDKDRDTFRRFMNDRIPVAIHMLLGCMSVIIQFLTMIIHFEGVFAGVAINTSIAFVLGLYWEVATNLDDPSKGVWYSEIPREWFS